MHRTLTISDHVYSRLAAEANSEGLGSVEEWLQELVASLPRSPTTRSAALTAPQQQAEEGSAVIGQNLDEFIGDWSEAEEKEFLASVSVFEQIDNTLWQ